ncbi:MAG TPA: PilZ domain-containing protein [Terriglobales bacterium]|nr:PilZ domain-containing protein [Terriglobales bacterium]
MTPDMAFECLLVSSDPGVFGTIDRILRELSIHTKICLRSSRAFDVLANGGTDLIVIDWEGEASSDLLHEIWKFGKTRKPTIIAISALDRPIPGAHVVLRKPVTAESGAKGIRSAYLRMLRDHRVHARYPLMMALTATDEANKAVPVTVTDIGDGGVGLNTKAQLTIGETLSIRLMLPGLKRDIYMQVRVLWTREYGAAGCKFLRIPPVDCEILQDWLRNKSQVKKPMIAV